MTLSRALGGIGRTLITSGCMVLLFVAYQLWGTGIQAGAAQEELAGDFTALLEAVPVEATPEPETITAELVDDDATEVDLGLVETEPEPTPTPTPVPEEFLRQLYAEAGDPISRIVIDAIDVDQVVVEGTDVDDLRQGPGHYRTTALPGQAGNAAIAGHRTTYGAPFHRVDELVPGDEIKVQTLQGTFTYRVMDSGGGKGHTIVAPSQVEVLSDFGDNRLTLTACHPKYSAAQRIIVFAELVGEPVDTLPKPDGWGGTGDAGLQGDEYDERAEGEDPDETDPETEDEVAADVPDAEGDSTAEEAVTDEADEIETEAGDDEADAALASDLDGTDDGSGVVLTTEVDAEDDRTREVAAGEGPIGDGFGSGLNGDSDAILPAISWGLAAMAVWLTAKFLGRRTMRIPAYALALAPFALTLWMSFQHIDQAIPSY